MKPYEPSPEAVAAAERINAQARASQLAWQSGRLPDGCRLPWPLRVYAWFTRKIGIHVWELYWIHKQNTRLGVCRVIGGKLVDSVNKGLRLW